MGEVEGNQVVSQQEVGVLGDSLEPLDVAGGEVGLGWYNVAGVRTVCGQGPEPAAFRRNLQVD